MSNFYYAYGLVIHANRHISGLVALPPVPTPQVDVQVYLGGLPPWAEQVVGEPQETYFVSPYCEENGQPILTIWKLKGGAYLRILYTDGTEFIVDRDGTKVIANWPPTSTLKDTVSYLLGPILGFVLRLRGVICLHASAINVEGLAIVFVGQKGAGKSTTAAAFARKHYPLLSDDIAALSEDQEGTILVQPGYPRMRLLPDSLKQLSGVASSFPPLPQIGGGRRYHFDLIQNGYRFQHQPLSLTAIYLLDVRCSDPSAPYIEDDCVQGAFVSLVENTFSNLSLDRDRRAQEFEFLGRLVKNVPIRRVHPHKEAAYLSKLCDVILDDFKKLTSSQPEVGLQMSPAKQNMGYFYSIFGLTMQVNRSIEGLIALPDIPEHQVDVQLCLGRVHHWAEEIPKAPEEIWYVSPYKDKHRNAILTILKLGDGAYFRLLFSDGNEFIIDRPGSRIWATWQKISTLENATYYLLNTVLSFMLLLRGVTCLHASSIAVGGKAIVFIGPDCSGKSITAAEFAKRDFPVLSDDHVALLENEGTFVVPPAFPWLRPRPEPQDIQQEASNAPKRMTPRGDDCYIHIDLTQNGFKFQQESVPLGAIYFLDKRCSELSAPYVEDLSAIEGLMTSIANTWTPHIGDKAMCTQEFYLLGRLVFNVPFRRVCPHEDPAYISKLCDVILDDFQKLTSDANSLKSVR